MYALIYLHYFPFLTSPQDFPGIFTCSLNDNMSTIYDTIRRSRVHRFIVIDEQRKLKGVVTLSDVLEHTLLEGMEDEE